ncbi:hypothetical protein F5Y12DRAFT_712996 [Xylaria sp. FL1777]|nr:hypothetical protein F5Y12DRAFT_712996 [Xylaria sp. FL1777]
MFVNQDQRPGAGYVEASSHPPSYNSLEHKSKKSSVPLNRNSRLLRLLRLQPAVIYLLIVSLQFAGAGDDSYISLIFTSPLVFWDLVGIANARNRFSTIPLELTLLLEFTFFGSFLYLLSAYLKAISLRDFYEGQVDGVNSTIEETVLCVLILYGVPLPDHYDIEAHRQSLRSVGAIYLYLDIRAYPAYWRYKRDYRRIKPVIVFTERGNPVAVFPPSQGTMLRRLSVDSLQGPFADQGDINA